MFANLLGEGAGEQGTLTLFCTLEQVGMGCTEPALEVAGWAELWPGWGKTW